MPENSPQDDAAAAVHAPPAINLLLLAGAIGSLIAGPAPHVARYLARVDERLAELPNDACRRGFLGDELAKWETRYCRYVAKVDRGLETDSQVTAWDHVETMAELDKRLARLPQ